jgi:hypothetical protein
VKEPVEPERQKMKPSKYRAIVEAIFMLISKVTCAVQARSSYIDAYYIDIDTLLWTTNRKSLSMREP